MAEETLKLRPVPPDEEQRSDCIRCAEELLAKAKVGEISGFVAVMDHPGMDWSYIQTYNQDRIALLGKLALALVSLGSDLRGC